ncbi:hypothetical protein HAX54_036151 [Datura stramonium]|uniref:Uncharacterized protein n=1 Tax=Datura stramonium TaxID=4076 RepID=A0ABS8VGF5_DATST|nr:hypothetical protein [Datura stramonium]
MATRYINLRSHIGGILVSEVELVYIRVGGPNKDFTNKVGEGLSAPLDKGIELIDGRGQIEGVQSSNMIGNSSGNTNDLEDKFELSNEEEDDVEATVHCEVEDDENIDLFGDEDSYRSDIHEELNIFKTDLKA